MLTTAGALHQPASAGHQSYVWFSQDGRSWGEGAPIGDPDVWLWRVVWRDGTAYGVGYSVTDDRFARLYRSADGKRFERLVERLHDRGYPSIGCEPCTRAVRPGEHPRAGRWWWEQDGAKKECGLHAIPVKVLETAL